MRKWAIIAQALLPGLALIPGLNIAPFVPIIATGIAEADAIHGDDDAAKRKHVLNLVALTAQGLQATGKVQVDPRAAVDTTDSIFDAIDAFKKAVKDVPALPFLMLPPAAIPGHTDLPE